MPPKTLEEQGIIKIPLSCEPAIIQLIAEGQATLNDLSPGNRRSLGSIASKTGIFKLTKARVNHSVITTETEIKIIGKDKRHLRIIKDTSTGYS